jgi:nucleoside 2-deoxyribosyltransferase
MRVYLSGPIEYAADGGKGWRNQLKERFAGSDFVLVDPCDSSLPILQRSGLVSVNEYHRLKQNFEAYPSNKQIFHSATRNLIDHDINEVRKADLLFAKISETASGGTSGELTLAYFLGIPIIAFCEEDLSTVSGWVQSLPRSLFTGEEALEKAIDSLFLFGTF